MGKVASDEPKPFKVCSMCRYAWLESADFFKDSSLRYIGHQVSCNAEQPGLLMFLHSCGTTLAVINSGLEEMQAVDPKQRPRETANASTNASHQS